MTFTELAAAWMDTHGLSDSNGLKGCLEMQDRAVVRSGVAVYPARTVTTVAGTQARPARRFDF